MSDLNINILSDPSLGYIYLPSSVNWWLAGGISAANCVEVYQPKGAASYAASKINLANPGTYDAADGAAFPTWSSQIGWTFVGASSQYLTTGYIPADQNHSLIIRFCNGYEDSANLILGALNAVATINQEFSNDHSDVVDYINGAVPFVSIAPGLDHGVLAMAGNKAYRNGVNEGGNLSAWGAGTAVAPNIGGRNFNGVAGTFWTGMVQAFAAYNIALTPAQVLAVTNAMNDIVSLREVLIFDGDSLTLGTDDNNSYPNQFLGLIAGTSYFSYIYGIGGQTLAQMEADAAAQIDVLYQSGRKNVVFCWGGENDLITQTAATTITRLETYCSNRQAAGFQVIVFTLLPNGGDVPPTYEADRQTVNTSIRANWENYADALCDVGGNEFIGDAGDEHDTTYFNVDEVHLNATGYGIVAALAKTAYDTL